MNMTANNPNNGPQTETVIADFPAYDVIRRTGAFGKPVRITTADRLGVHVHTANGDFYREYSPGSVVSYALYSEECPIRAVERAKSHGHDLHWLNQCATAITSHKQAKRHLIEVAVGMTILFEGRRFRITRTPNHNLGLDEIE